ncbi:hypothetical protein VOLCADRAFT_88039 [Volvox carteri f. nagariensis]|uniref:Ferric oxidoreductase domain-containing protein n=1 Tax=Volvox carteri f. nagariensis TaxID=3068 RepID=D8TMX1_VOLCA|nr:uncharacterized protein VOLCADRAFT_88039 [Volvox carteri f. nagariensis]EFJ51202.1 hypothetical protein VOLCADRAFT_88039 [Volvox carteri f. nagariensis]|eukprot:XP_002947669.1 hypothetical protein VOLCADRAFT_88039 [Volvox carteri f. nagariensis]
MSIPPRWLPASLVIFAGVVLTCSIWLSEESSLAAIPWPWHNFIPPPAVTNAILLAFAGVTCIVLAPAGRPLLPLRAKSLIYFFWLGLNLLWFIAGIRDRDFRKPSWLNQTRVPSRAKHLSEPVLRLLRLLYGVGMASAWPLLGNLFVALLSGTDRGLFLLGACLGGGLGHEEGVLSHALCGTAVWVWAASHALLTQIPMLVAGLWRVIVLPPWDGSETKATSNFMGLMAFLSLCALGVSSLAPLRRRFFNTFQVLHLVLAPAVLLFGCLHDKNIFWYGMLGATLYAADVVQRWMLRRRTAVATATVYPHHSRYSAAISHSLAAVTSTGRNPTTSHGSVVATVAAASTGSVAVAMGGGSGTGALDDRQFVVLRIHTGGGAPGCVCGQHVYLKVDRGVGGRGGEVDVGVCGEDRLLLFAGGAGITPIASILQALLVTTPAAAAPPPGYDTAAKDWIPQGHKPRNTQPGEIPPTSPPLPPPPPQHQLTAGASGIGVWAVSGGAAAATAAAAAATEKTSDAAAAAASAAWSCSHVHLVWASDAQPLLPLLRAAVARGWTVDLHCTRQPCRTSPSTTVKPCTASTVCRSSAAAMSIAGPTAAAAAAAHDDGAPGPDAVAKVKVMAAPWQLQGPACWGVAALAALLGAVGANLGSTAASTHNCMVATPAALGAGGEGGSFDTAAAEWMASVRAAFRPSAAYDGAGGGSAWSWLLTAALQGSAATSVLRCPASLLPSAVRQGLDAALAKGIHAAGKKALKAAGGVGTVSLKVCRAFGVAAPELCVKCDPFKGPGSGLDRLWPCCQARVCFFAARLAPLLGWVAGVLLGAAAACLVWQRWRMAAAAAGRGSGRRRRVLLPAPPPSHPAAGGSWLRGLWARSPAGGVARHEARAAEGRLHEVHDGVGNSDSHCAADGTAADGTLAVERAMEEGGAGIRTNAATAGAAAAGGSRHLLPGLEAMMLPGVLADVEAEAEAGVEAFQRTYGEEVGGVSGGTEGGGVSGGSTERHGDISGKQVVLKSGPQLRGAGIRVHVGRPDVDAYVGGEAAASGGGGCSAYPRAAAAATYRDVVVFGVVVCGPESLQAAVEAAYQRHLHKAYPKSWFRGFSFTTSTEGPMPTPDITPDETLRVWPFQHRLQSQTTDTN